MFFIQERPGKDGKPFKMIKFRSMRDAIDKDGNPLPDGERLTDFGKKITCHQRTNFLNYGMS